MTPETIKLLFFVLGRSLVTVLAERGKFDQAAVVTDALAAVKAGRNIDAALAVLAEQWAQGEPPLAAISEARMAIQAQMGD
jgi:hypothetical protein